MSTLSKSAKAAAIMAFTRGLADHGQAAALYDAMAQSDDPLDAVLEDRYPGVCRWCDQATLDEHSWWEAVENLACNIEAARKHFQE